MKLQQNFKALVILGAPSKGVEGNCLHEFSFPFSSILSTMFQINPHIFVKFVHMEKSRSSQLGSIPNVFSSHFSCGKNFYFLGFSRIVRCKTNGAFICSSSCSCPFPIQMSARRPPLASVFSSLVPGEENPAGSSSLQLLTHTSAELANLWLKRLLSLAPFSSLPAA